jgi:hypothetical protein
MEYYGPYLGSMGSRGVKLKRQNAPHDERDGIGIHTRIPSLHHDVNPEGDLVRGGLRIDLRCQ